MGDFIKGLFEITVDSINLTFFTCRLLDNFFSSHDLLSESNVTFVSALFHQLKSTLILLPVKRLHSFRSWFTPKLSDFQRRSWTMPMSQNVNGWWCSLRVPSMSNVGRDAGASAALLFPVGLAYYVCAQEASNVWVSFIFSFLFLCASRFADDSRTVVKTVSKQNARPYTGSSGASNHSTTGQIT